MRVLSGGVGFHRTDARGKVTELAPLNDGSGWPGTFRNEGSTNLTGYIRAVCVRL